MSYQILKCQSCQRKFAIEVTPVDTIDNEGACWWIRGDCINGSFWEISCPCCQSKFIEKGFIDIEEALYNNMIVEETT